MLPAVIIVIIIVWIALFSHAAPEGDTGTIVIVRGQTVIAWDAATDDELVIESVDDLIEFAYAHD